jgi:hypothetical protein
MLGRLLSILFLSNVSHATITDCGLSKSLFKLNAAGFWPDPAVKNDNSTVSLDFTVPEGVTINEGTVRYSLTYNFIPLSPSVEPLCPNNIECPIVPGTFNKSTSSIFPSGVSGTMVIKSEWFGPTNNLLLCYQIRTKV